MTSDRCALYRRFIAVDGAYRSGDLDALKRALGDPEGFPNCLLPFDLAVGDHPLEYAITRSPLPFVRTLLEIGADPNHPAQDGFPSLIEALATDRPDRHAILGLLLDFGADVQQRGHNDWTPVHYAVVRRDLAAVRLLLARGADPAARTRVDECSTPLEDAEAIGFTKAVALLRDAHSRSCSGRDA
jgi:ankyrin repeat protein